VKRVLAAARPAARGLRANWLFAFILAGGVFLRVMATAAYRPAILYVDSLYVYLNHLPGTTLPFSEKAVPDPLGYNMLLLQPMLAVGNLFTVVTIQHVLGLAMGVFIYIVMRRWGVWRWLAALATAPVLLDAYQVQIEHTIMSDSLFQALLVAAFAAIAWRRRPTTPALVIAGVALGAAGTVRSVGLPVFAVFIVYVLATRPGWLAWRGKLVGAAVLVIAGVIPVAGYQLYATHTETHLAAQDVRSNTLYARVATFVDCGSLKLPADEVQLCPKEPLKQRHTPDFYAHSPDSPLFHVTLPPGKSLNELTTDFSLRAVRAQPLGLVRVVAADAARAFTWNHDDYSNPDAPTERWRFQNTFPLYPDAVTPPVLRYVTNEFGGGPPQWQMWPAAFLRTYQLNVGFTPGPAIALALLLACAALVVRGRTRGAPMRAVTALYLFGGVSVLLIADAYEFSWRYQLPGLVLIPLAGALGLRTLFWRPAPIPFPHPDDVSATEVFDAEHPDLRLPPVVVLIAAYNEAKGIGRVLDGIPDKTLDLSAGDPLEVATLVVVDGGTDDTAAIAGSHGAYVATLPRNRGQGAALRLGYFLARRGGARYIVTTDGDGQYDIDALPTLLEPLRRGEADFVTGSRILGANESTDQVRRAGTKFFASLVRLLTGFKSTDTSFGMRAMRSSVTAGLVLDQPQYQSSELLIGLIMRGYRVVEVPGTMRVRNSGKSKKGNNLVYGARYARVVLSTWSRERRLRRLASARRDSIASISAASVAASSADSSGPGSVAASALASAPPSGEALAVSAFGAVPIERLRAENTNRSNTRNLATNMTANDPK
jgi:glycosyltransferase involved in cell wall biosynthesis